MGFELEGKVTPKIVRNAVVALQKEYPYLRTVLKQDMNQLAFIEQPVVWSRPELPTFSLNHLSSTAFLSGSPQYA